MRAAIMPDRFHIGERTKLRGIYTSGMLLYT
jgi:hypothetical protein